MTDQTSIGIFNVAYFMASKLEALKYERHGKDYRLNSDFKDIVYLSDNRTTLLSDLLQSEDQVKSYLKKEIERLLLRPSVRKEVVANLDFSNSSRRTERIIELWQKLIE